MAHSLNMYADDHQLYTNGKTVEDIQNKLTKDDKVISHWYINNLLKGNFNKYQSMTRGPKGKLNVKDIKITMSNTKVKSGSEMRLLGLTIDANLNFSSHISDRCKRASRK